MVLHLLRGPRLDDDVEKDITECEHSESAVKKRMSLSWFEKQDEPQDQTNKAQPQGQNKSARG